MNNGENQITSTQLLNFILSVQISIGILTLPADLALTCGHDGWISVLVYGVLTSVVIFIMILLMKRFGNKSIYEINKNLYGKYLGGAFNLLIVMYLWYTSCLCLRTYISILQVTMLRLTPSLILSAFVMIPTCYLTWNGIKYVARYSFIIYFTLIIFFLLFFLVFKDLRFTFLMPVFESGIEGIKASFNSCAYAFLGYELISIIYPEITNKRKTMKYALCANLITTVFYVVVVLVTTSFFGEEMLKKVLYPIIKLSRSYKAPIVERIDLILVSIWIPSMAMGCMGYFSACYYSINKLFHFKKNVIYFILFSLITILLSRIPKSNSNLSNYNFYMLISGAIFSIFLVLSYIFSFIRKNGVKRIG